LPQIPTAYASSWAPSHQTASPIRESALLEQIPLSKHTWELKIIATWNTKGRVCLNAHNKDWIKQLVKEILEAKWEIQNIHNHPYQTALGSGQHSGLNKFNKLPNDPLKPQKAQLKQVP